MSQNPISTTFQLQRQSIEQSQQAVKRGIEFQQRAGEAFLTSLASQESAQRQTVEVTRSATHAYLDAIEATIPGVAPTVAEIRGALDDQFEVVLDGHEEAFAELETQLEEGVDSYDEATEEFVETIDEQIEAVLAAHEDVETQTLDAFEELQGQIEDFQTQVQEQVEDVQQQVEDVQQQVAEGTQADA